MIKYSKELMGNDHAFLRQTVATKKVNDKKRIVKLVDLFCGCGGISLGVQEACNTLKYNLEIPLAVDFDKEAIECYYANFPQASVRNCDIGMLFTSALGATFSDEERTLQALVGDVDILVGGPPCQGHSDLNRYTRRNDPKNSLYLYMARAAEVFKPKNIIIENVVGAIHDKGQVVQTVERHLRNMGYYVSVGFVDLVDIGVPQTRRRLILVASKVTRVDVNTIPCKYSISEERTVKWAIDDLQHPTCNNIMNTPSMPSKDNRVRIRYLFEHDLYDLPNEQRPPCHRDKPHSYNSIYGRLHWDMPSQTITSGFYSACMGRYVHPSEERTLTAHEAARLQFFPDYFDFSTVNSRTALATIIGNAVPMKLPYLVSIELLSKGGD
ncbi:MAG TPA: DNA cytosine methyltransferase [Alphaproteobacteria bacterium]|nr:DNA cytosine methyltransferase [Alphaproteobacteria bacterium]